jgi:NAD(P)-dependent dehydrogenase (short-subunit alcohol dehydrogenase family)
LSLAPVGQNASMRSMPDRGAPSVLAIGCVDAGRGGWDVHDYTQGAVALLGAVAAATAVVGPMIERGSGSILFTTGAAAINPPAQRAGVGISFAGEVAYARMLHDELAGRGIHVGHTAIAGRIGPGQDHEPDAIAEVLWRQHVDRSVFQVRIGIA